MRDPIAFYFDFASPYGYLGATQIDALAARFGREVDWRPILLGAVFQQTGRRPLREIPMRGPYLDVDLPRFAELLGVPFAFPETWPIAALASSRAVWWLRDRDPAAARDLAAALYRAYWAEGRSIATPAAVAEIAKDSVGVDPAELFQAVQQPEIKQRLRAETEAAIALGVFGSPFFLLDGEPFWGADRLDHLAWRLAG